MSDFSSKSSDDLSRAANEKQKVKRRSKSNEKQLYMDPLRETTERSSHVSSSCEDKERDSSLRKARKEQRRLERLEKENQYRWQQLRREQDELIAHQLATRCVTETFRSRQIFTNPMADPREDAKYASRVAQELTAQMLHKNGAKQHGQIVNRRSSGSTGSIAPLASNAAYTLPTDISSNTSYVLPTEINMQRLTKNDRVQMERQRLERQMAEATKRDTTSKRTLRLLSWFNFGRRKKR